MYFLYGLIGVLGGVLGGMGMGGGTILIPLLTIIFGVYQHSAQAANLISFIPMATVSLCVHIKHKLIDFKNILFIVIPGILTCILGCFLASVTNGEVLKKCFGGFLILLSVFQFLAGIKKEK